MDTDLEKEGKERTAASLSSLLQSSFSFGLQRGRGRERRACRRRVAGKTRREEGRGCRERLQKVVNRSERAESCTGERATCVEQDGEEEVEGR